MAEAHIFRISDRISTYAVEFGRIPAVADKATTRAALRISRQLARLAANAVSNG